MHRRSWCLLLAAALLLGLYTTGCKPQQQGPPMFPDAEVAVVTLQTEKVLLHSELPGRTASFLIAEIRPQVNGLLQKRCFTEGAQVKAGDPLYEIDPAPYKAAYDTALANVGAAKEAADRARATLAATKAGVKRYEALLKLAKTSLARYEKLIKTNAVSAMDHDKAVAEVDTADAGLKVAQAQIDSDKEAVEAAEAAIKQAESAVETARINLGYTKITAPITGRIGRSNVTEGAIVTAYQPAALATIQQLDPIYVDVPQSTAELTRLRRSLANGRLKNNGTDKVKIVLEDGTEYTKEGSLQFRDVTVDPTTGSIILRIVVPNPDMTLLPGMFVRAVIDEGVNEKALLVPQQAVQRDPKGNPIALVVDAKDTAERRSISTERALGDKWLVTSGLAAGDRVIVEGLLKVRPGAHVKVVPFKPAAEGPKTAEAGAEKTPEKTAEKASAKAAPKTADKPGADSAEKAAAKSGEQAAKQAAETTAQKSTN